MTTQRTFYVGLDDTDSPDRGGTGQLARHLARVIDAEDGLCVDGVSRHPLSKDPRVPCTRKNQCSCLVVLERPGAFEGWRDALQEIVVDRSIPGSDPGLCIAAEERISPRIVEWGFDAKRTLLAQPGAFALAASEGVWLEALGGDGDGVIGALAAVGLRRSGDDGRLTQYRDVRRLAGVQPVSSILEAGVDAVLDEAGRPLDPDERLDTLGKVRPLLRGGRRLLRAARRADSIWEIVQVR